MGNAILYRENLRRTAAERMSKALRSFIERECPIYLTALKSDDHKLREIVVKQFNESFPDYIFDNIYSILPHLERLRLKGVKQLNELTSIKFNGLPRIKLSCLPCKINDYLSLAYFDTGCSISCITLANARKLNLISLIDYNVNGVAVGFGCNRQIVGFLPNLPVQISSELLFNINFVVINQANADFILIGYDFLVKYGLKMDYLNGKIIFPQQIIKEHKLDFVPNESTEQRDLFFDLFKYEMLNQNRVLMGNYFNSNESKRDFQNNKDSNSKTNHKSTNTNLYIRISINGKHLFALIDTGADTCKISDNLALQLDILRFIDYEKNKIAHGLGSVVSLGLIPPIPLKFESSDDTADEKKQSTILFMPFEVLKERRVNILLLGSDFFTYYGCYLDFSAKSIDIPLKPPCKYKLDEQEPSRLVNDSYTDRSLLMNHNYLENENCGERSDEVVSTFGLGVELDELRKRIMNKEHEYRIKKKLRKYKLNQKDTLFHLFGKPSDRSIKCDSLLSTALGTFKQKSFKSLDLAELHEQTSLFLNDENHQIYESINEIQEFKNQSSNEIYCNGLLVGSKIEDSNSIVKINLVN